jgi:hypothetical protein
MNIKKENQMSIEYSWKVINIKVIPEISEKNNVVKIIDFMLEGTRNEKNNFVLGSVELPFDPESDTFIPFENLTEETVIAWIKSALGQEKIDQYIDTIEQRFGPESVISTKLPWISTNNSEVEVEDDILA